MVDQARLEMLAQKAIRRNRRESQFASRSEMVLIHARAVRAAQDDLDTSGAVAAAWLHRRINEILIEEGIARVSGAALVPA